MKTKQELINKILEKNKQVRDIPELNNHFLRQYDEKALKFINEVYDDILLDIILISFEIINTKKRKKICKK